MPALHAPKKTVRRFDDLADVHIPTTPAALDLLGWDDENEYWSKFSAEDLGLAPLESVLLKDGSVALTGNLSAGGNRITSIGSPSGANDAATKGYVDALLQGLQSKARVRAATIAAGTLASDFEEGDTIDTVVLVAGDRILIKDQTSKVENGIYIVNASGAPTRSDDVPAGSSAASIYCWVTEGDENDNKGFVCISDPGSDVVGTNDLDFTQFNGAGGGASSLDELSDVAITGLSDGQILKAVSGIFVNSSLAGAGISAVGHTHTASNITDFNTAADARIAAAVLNALSDTNLGSPSNDQVIAWDSATSKWIAKTLSGGSASSNWAGNYLLNTSFRTWGHNYSVSGLTLTDGGYVGPTGWYQLSSGTTCSVAQGTGLGNSATSLVLTNSSGSPRRMGTAHPIEYYDCRQLRGKQVTFQIASKRSTTGNVRVVVLEWTGTANAPTKDVVNDWASSTFTGGNFFISTNYNVLAVSSAVSVGTSATNVSVTATIGASANNIIVFAWSDGTVENDGTIEFSEAQLVRGASAGTYDEQPYDIEGFRCDYRCRLHFSDANQTDAILGWGHAQATTALVCQVPFGHPMRVVPTVSFTASNWQVADSVGSRQTCTNLSISSTVSSRRISFVTATVSSGLTVGRGGAVLADTTAGRFIVFDAEIGV